MQTKKNILNFKLEPEKHREFKAICTLQGKTMQEVISGFVSEYIKANNFKTNG